MRQRIFSHFSQNGELEPLYNKRGTIWAGLDAPRQRASFEIPRSPNSCSFLSFWVEIVVGLYSGGFFHGHTSTRTLYQLMALLGLGVPSQCEREQHHLTSTVSCGQWRRTTSSLLVYFSGSFWTQLNATGCARTQHGPQGQSSSSTSDGPSPGHWDKDRMRLSESMARIDQAELP